MLGTLEEGCELVLALAAAPGMCEMRYEVTRTDARRCDVLRCTRYVRNEVRDSAIRETRFAAEREERDEVV